MREKRSWKSVRVLESRLRMLEAEAKLRSGDDRTVHVSDVLDEILGLHEQSLIDAKEAMEESQVES